MEMNYYETLTPEQKQEWDANEKHLWEVELPEDLRQAKRTADEIWAFQGFTWKWIGAEDWHFGWLGWMFLTPPPQACRRIVRLSLPNSGQLRVSEKFGTYHDVMNDGKCDGDKCLCHCPDFATWTEFRYEHYTESRRRSGSYPSKYRFGIEADLLATSEIDGAIHRWRGMLLSTDKCEMSGSAVVFGSGTPQIIADRCANILDATMESNGENFYALLDGVDRCAICHHPLRDPISKLVAVGPDCAEKFGIPHTLEAAQKRLELRKKLLGTTGSTQP